MKRLLITLTGLLTFGLMAGAQETTQATETAMVRVVNLSPNAQAVDIRLAGTREGGTVLEGEGMSGLSYEQVGDYMEVPAGEYTATVSADGMTAAEETVNFGAGNAYTVAAIGLLLPGEDGEQEESGGGFFDWLEGLFGGDSDRQDALALRLQVVEDDLDRQVFEGETTLRAVHAAPGTEAIDIAFEKERGSVIGGLAFGETSRYATLDLSQGEGNLVVRISGSRALAIDLDEAGLEPNTVNTIYVIGTPLEGSPLKTLVVTNPAQVEPRPEDAATTTAPAAPVTTTETEQADTDEADADEGAADPQMQNVVDVIAADPNLSTLTGLLGQAGLTDTLAAEGPFTVFAPTNDAFAALSQEQLDALNSDPEMLRNVLLRHVTEGSVLSGDLNPDAPVATLAGGELTYADGTLGGANVVTADLEASNGVVHVIDRVLLPEDMDSN